MPNDSKEKNLFVVGIGASAGGLEALRALFSQVEESDKYAFVVVQHLAPSHKSRLVELIAHTAKVKVEEIANNTQIKGNKIYICPPNKDVFVENGHLVLKEPRAKVGPKPSVDLFFHSLAAAYEDKAIGVILSGTGSDGSHGIRAIKAQGGITISQKIGDAKYDGMPKSAVNTGAIDLELTPEDIAKNLENLGELKRKISSNDDHDEDLTHYNRILNMVKKQIGVDFGEYKPSTIHRRMHRRMVAIQVESVEEYANYMREHLEETRAFFQDALISVTSFYRDPEYFKALEKELEKKFEYERKDPFRVWVVGCATGEEAFSLAIMLSEIIEKKSYHFSFQIFATDLDEPALEIARKGCFPKSSFEDFPSELKDKYFSAKDDGLKVRNDIRDTVVFAKHNVITDPPFLNIDLISCRNVLIYFGKELQDRVLNTFHYSMADKGVLFLGKSENVPMDHNQFETRDKGAKIYGKIPGSHRSSLMQLNTFPEIGGESKAPKKHKREIVPDIDRIKEIVEGIAPDSILLDGNQDVQHIFGEAGKRLKFAKGQITNNILKLVDKKLALELSSLLHRASSKEVAVIGRQNEEAKEGVLEITQIKVLPLKNFSQYRFLIIFESFETPIDGPQEELTEGSQDEQVKKLQQELAFTRQHLQNVVEEHETANEELQSLNEEMQSTNEELQSSNEELETTNEELQSSNEELTTLNEELNVKSNELQISNQRMEAIQQAIVYPLLIVDSSLRLVGFNDAARYLLRVTDNDIGHFIKSVPTSFDIKPIVKALTGKNQDIKEANFQFEERDRKFEIQVQPILDHKDNNQGAVVSFVENTDIVNALAASQATEERMSNILENIPSAVCKKDLSGVYVYANQRFLDVHDLNRDQVIGYTDEEIFEQEMADEIRERDLEVFKAKKARNFDESFIINGKQTFWTSSRIPLFDDKKRPQSICWVSTNITQRRERELKLEVFQNAISLATHGVAIFETYKEAYRSIFVSDNLTEDLGLNIGDLDNLNVENFFKKAIPKDSHLSAKSIVNALKKELNQSFVVENKKQEGSRFLEYKCSVIKQTDKNLEGIVVTVFDVTEKLSNERTIAKQQEELMRFGRYASLGEISAGFAHEINTPLNVILSNLDVMTTLADAGELNAEEAHKIGEEVENVVQAISGIVQGMKSIAGNKEKNREKIDIANLIRQSVQIAEFRLQRFGVRVDYGDIGPGTTIQCWKVQVIQILINLINNSIDAIEDQKDKWIKFSAKENGENIDIIVQDSGHGIDKKLAEKVMTPFFTTKDRKNDEGTGIGLSLSRSIARNHGGELFIDHDEKNTTFVLRLPKKCEKVADGIEL